MSSTRHRPGFTLIEVLLATFVIALGVLGILALFAGAAKQQQASSSETAAVFTTRNAESVLVQNFSALGLNPNGNPPQLDVWTVLPMKGIVNPREQRYLYLSAPAGLYFLVTVTQPTLLYERPPPSGLTFEMPNEQQPYRFGTTLEPALNPLPPTGEPPLFDPDPSTAAIDPIFPIAFKDRQLDPDSIRMRVTFSRVEDPDGDGEYERANFEKTFSRRPGAMNQTNPEIYSSDNAARGSGIWTIPLDGDPCNDSVVQTGPLALCSSDPLLNHEASYIKIDVQPSPTGVDPARIDSFHFAEIALETGLGLTESVRVEKIEALEYKWQNDQVVSLEDRISTRLDSSQQPSGERPDQSYSVLFRRTQNGAEAAVVTYQLTATSSGAEYVPPEFKGDIALGNSPLRVGTMNLHYDPDVDQYYFRVADETMLWAIRPGQVLFVQGNPLPPPIMAGSEFPVKIVRQVRESSLQGTPQWRGYLEGNRPPRVSSPPEASVSVIPWPDAIAGGFVQLRVIGVRESVVSRVDDSIWKLTPLRATVFSVPYQ